jgi:hypothetical protein
LERETPIHAVDEGPVRVHMNDGTFFDIADHKSCAVDSSTASVLYRDEKDNRVKAHWLSLDCMVRVERLDAVT